MLTPTLDLTGPAIFTRYLGPTNHRPSRIVATHKRDRTHTIRATVAWDDALESTENHKAAALACLRKAEFSRPLTLEARGHDADCYVWVAVGLWQVEPAALAMAAARELMAALSGDGDAESLALPLALARMATGAAPVAPVIDGWALAPSALRLTDCLGQPIPGLKLPVTLSPAGALAAAKAAGWLLTAPTAATAARHTEGLGLSVDPEALALALAARGGCPAVIATLSAKGAAL